MTAESVAWVVLFLSAFYLLDRLVVWAVDRGLAAYRRRHARAGHHGPGRAPGVSRPEEPPAA